MSFFSLIELMVVIAVICILLGILLPAFASVKTKGKRSQAQADITAMLNACRLFESDYGSLPNVFPASAPTCLAPVDSGTFAKANTDSSPYYMSLMGALSGFSYFTSTPCYGLNVRGVKYLQVPRYYSNNAMKNPKEPCGFVDPWGNTYGVSLDIAGSGQSTISYPSGLVDSKGASVASSEAVFSRVAAYSLGPDAQWQSDGVTLKASNADTSVKSWK